MARPTASDSTIPGTIKTLKVDKGFGFIRADGPGGGEYFFHRDAAPEFEAFAVGSAVTFVPSQGAKGPRADQVRLA